MILDEGRLLNILSSLPEDIKDTIESLLEKIELDLAYEKGLQSDIEVLEKTIEVLEKTIEELKKQMALDKQPTPPVFRLSSSPPAAQPPAAQPGRYIATGNTYPVKDLLKSWGFRWNALDKQWFLPDLGRSSEEAVMKVRGLLKEQGKEDAEIVFVAGK